MSVIVGGTNYYIEALLWNTLVGNGKVSLFLTLATNTISIPFPLCGHSAGY